MPQPLHALGCFTAVVAIYILQPVDWLVRFVREEGGQMRVFVCRFSTLPHGQLSSLKTRVYCYTSMYAHFRVGAAEDKVSHFPCRWRNTVFVSRGAQTLDECLLLFRGVSPRPHCYSDNHVLTTLWTKQCLRWDQGTSASPYC